MQDFWSSERVSEWKCIATRWTLLYQKKLWQLAWVWASISRLGNSFSIEALKKLDVWTQSTAKIFWRATWMRALSTSNLWRRTHHFFVSEFEEVQGYVTLRSFMKACCFAAYLFRIRLFNFALTWVVSRCRRPGTIAVHRGRMFIESKPFLI